MIRPLVLSSLLKLYQCVADEYRHGPIPTAYEMSVLLHGPLTRSEEMFLESQQVTVTGNIWRISGEEILRLAEQDDLPPALPQ
jgi:hypothetical protein